MSDDQNEATPPGKTTKTPEAQAAETAGQNVQPAGLQNLIPGSPSPAAATGEAGATSDVNLGVILDVPVTISVEIGRTHIPIRQLLQYNQGSVIELDRHVGEALDVLVNNALIAHGEVVMIDDQFGIRLTEVVSPSERVKKLQ